MKRATDEERPPIVGLARYLVHVGTPEAIEGAFATVAGDAEGKERVDLFEMLVGASGLTNERLQVIVDAGGDGGMCRMAAEILGRRGDAEGYRALFELFGTKRLFEELIARGPEGIRALACAFPHFDDSDGLIAQRIAAHPPR